MYKRVRAHALVIMTKAETTLLLQAITARSASTTESRTTASLSAKSRRTDKTSTNEESDTGSDATVSVGSRRSAVSQLAAAAMAAAPDSSGRRHLNREQGRVEDESAGMAGGDAKEKTSGGLIAVDDVSMVIAQFFKRYDDIGIPNDDDLARFWDQDPSMFGRCVMESGGIEAGDSEVMLPAEGKGTGGDWREAVPMPVEHATEAVTEVIVSTEEDHEYAGHDAGIDDIKPHSTDTDELVHVTGVDDEDGCDTYDAIYTIVDDGQPALDAEDIIVSDSISVGNNTALSHDSTESHDDDGEQRQETEEQQKLEPLEMGEEKSEESRDTDEQHVVESHDKDGSTW